MHVDVNHWGKLVLSHADNLLTEQTIVSAECAGLYQLILFADGLHPLVTELDSSNLKYFVKYYEL